MLRLAPHHEANSAGVQLAENLSVWRAWREFVNFKNEHGEPVNTREFQEAVAKTAREKIDVLTSTRNRALIEQFRANSGRQTSLLQARHHATALQTAAEAAVLDLNAKIETLNAAIPDGRAIPALELSALLADVGAKQSSLDENMSRLEEDNARIIVSFQNRDWVRILQVYLRRFVNISDR
jgi:hypothetical protein